VELPPDCPYSPGEYFVAWPFMGGWKGFRHGDPAAGEYRLEHCCDCGVCLATLAELNPLAAERVRRRAAEAEAERQRLAAVASHRKVDVVPAREHLRQLLATGRTMTSVAVDAGLDRTTLNRVLRPDVVRVRADTAQALLAVS
jgi:hypothetical protein